MGYRMGKFWRRNKGPVLAVSIVFAALLAGIAGTTLGLIWAEESAASRRPMKPKR